MQLLFKLKTGYPEFCKQIEDHLSLNGGFSKTFEHGQQKMYMKSFGKV